MALIRVVSLRLYERPLALPTSVPAPPGVEIAVWDSPEATSRAGAWHAEAQARLRGGQVCGVVLHGSAVVAYCWLACSPVGVAEIDQVVVPGPTDVYLYDAYTQAAWRGRGLFTTLLLHLCAFAGASGRERALIFVSPRNRASWRAIERAGFKKFHTVSRMDVGPLGRVWLRRPRSRASRVTLVEEA
jgi:RimJ/RimL family protein N-acetyltransferase